MPRLCRQVQALSEEQQKAVFSLVLLHLQPTGCPGKIQEWLLHERQKKKRGQAWVLLIVDELLIRQNFAMTLVLRHRE